MKEKKKSGEGEWKERKEEVYDAVIVVKLLGVSLSCFNGISLVEASILHDLQHCLTQLSRGVTDEDTCVLQGLNLVGRCSLSS